MKTQGAPTLARELSPENQQVMKFELNIAQIKVINALYKTGFWGNTPAETFRRFVDRAFEQQAEKLKTL